jgi:hypothetical protein
VVLGVVAPVLNIDIWQTGDKEFQLLLVEDGDKFRGNDVVKS